MLIIYQYYFLSHLNYNLYYIILVIIIMVIIHLDLL